MKALTVLYFKFGRCHQRHLAVSISCLCSGVNDSYTIEIGMVVRWLWISNPEFGYICIIVQRNTEWSKLDLSWGNISHSIVLKLFLLKLNFQKNEFQNVKSYQNTLGFTPKVWERLKCFESEGVCAVLGLDWGFHAPSMHQAAALPKSEIENVWECQERSIFALFLQIIFKFACWIFKCSKTGFSKYY